MKIKKIISALISIIMLLGLFSFPVTASISINDSSIYFKQTKSNTCTLVAMGMVFRRKAVLDGNNNWQKITESSMKEQGNWPAGLAGSPKFVVQKTGLNMRASSKHIYNMKENGYKRNSNPTSTISTLKKELDQHPEGIVLYLFNRVSQNTTKWMHAVTLTGYDKNGNFYCADPAGSAGNGIINLMDSILTDYKRANTESLEELLSYSVKIWYISSSSNTNTQSDVISGNISTAVTSCNHSYNKSGYCTNCGKEYNISLSSVNDTYEAVKNDVPIRNRPYSPDAIIGYLSKGNKVTVIGSGKNSVGNVWYQLSDGTWIFSDNLTKSTNETTGVQFQAPAPSAPTTSIKIELESIPSGNLPYGKSFSLKGWFRSDSAIVEARAYMLDANQNIVMQSEPASSTTSNYKIQGYKLDKAMKFSQLSPGGYYLKYYVRDANGDTATWQSDMFYIVK